MIPPGKGRRRAWLLEGKGGVDIFFKGPWTDVLQSQGHRILCLESKL